MRNVLVTIPMDDVQKARLEAVDTRATYTYFPAIDIQATGNPNLRIEDVQKADVILGDVPPQMLRNSKNLKFLQLDSAGVKDYINGVLPKDVLLTNATGAYGLGIAETMVAMMLMLKKNLHLYAKQQENHIWKCVGPVTAISDATVLCVGMGNIGGEFLKRCKALGAYTIGVCRTKREKPEWLDEIHQTDEVDELLSRADVVALNMPDTDRTRGMFDRTRLEKLRSSAILINAGRGNVLDTMVLCEMLNAGKIAGAAVDVTDPEPLPANHPLWDAKNMIITPHVTGGFTLKQTLDNIVELSIDNFKKYCNGSKLKNLVDFQQGYAAKN